MTSGSPTKPPGRPRWSSRYPSGASLEGSTGRRSSAGSRGWSWSTEPSSSTGYHTRERHSEESLPADVPVAVQALHPRLVPVTHVRRVPAQLAAPLEQAFAQGKRPNVPLAARDDLEGTLPAFVELDRMSDLLGLADDRPRVAEHLHDARPRLGDGATLELAVGTGRRRRIFRSPSLFAPGHGPQASVAPHHCAGGQCQLAPPRHVGGVTEGADHGDARALVGVGERVGEDGHADVEQGGDHVVADDVAVPVVLGMGDQCHARGEQFGARGFDLDPTVGSSPGEPQPVVRARRARGLRSRPGTPPSGSPRPTGWALPPSTRVPSGASRGRSAATCGARWCRWSCRSGPSPPTGRASATGARTPFRPRRPDARTAR